MDADEPERSAEIDRALRRSQEQERAELAHDLSRLAATDEAIITALTRGEARAGDEPDADPGAESAEQTSD